MRLAALGLFVVATVAMTWPTAWHAADRVPDLGDPLADAWILAWGADHLLRLDFGSFPAGNAFYPSPYAMTCDDLLLGWQPVALPSRPLTTGARRQLSGFGFRADG